MTVYSGFPTEKHKIMEGKKVLNVLKSDKNGKNTKKTLIQEKWWKHIQKTEKNTQKSDKIFRTCTKIWTFINFYLWLRFNSTFPWRWGGSVGVPSGGGAGGGALALVLADARLLLLWLSLPFFSLSWKQTKRRTAPFLLSFSSLFLSDFFPFPSFSCRLSANMKREQKLFCSIIVFCQKNYKKAKTEVNEVKLKRSHFSSAFYGTFSRFSGTFPYFGRLGFGCDAFFLVVARIVSLRRKQEGESLRGRRSCPAFGEGDDGEGEGRGDGGAGGARAQLVQHLRRTRTPSTPEHSMVPPVSTLRKLAD